MALGPSGDGSRVYVGLENGDALVFIDTLTNTVIPQAPSDKVPKRLRMSQMPYLTAMACRISSRRASLAKQHIWN
jgi:hypothetical protein